MTPPEAQPTADHGTPDVIPKIRTSPAIAE
jgi:hypothetical protein